MSNLCVVFELERAEKSSPGSALLLLSFKTCSKVVATQTNMSRRSVPVISPIATCFLSATRHTRIPCPPSRDVCRSLRMSQFTAHTTLPASTPLPNGRPAGMQLHLTNAHQSLSSVEPSVPRLLRKSAIMLWSVSFSSMLLKVPPPVSSVQSSLRVADYSMNEQDGSFRGGSDCAHAYCTSNASPCWIVSFTFSGTRTQDRISSSVRRRTHRIVLHRIEWLWRNVIAPVH